jgi:CheY-like chemotaxis protein
MPTPENAASPDCLRILAVEDNADALQMLCELLSLLGHEVSGASDAASALGLLTTQPFDILLTDVNLPGLSGIELARQAKAATPALKIVFASGHDETMSSHIGFPTTWLTKPYDFEALVKAVSQSGSA